MLHGRVPDHVDKTKYCRLDRCYSQLNEFAIFGGSLEKFPPACTTALGQSTAEASMVDKDHDSWKGARIFIPWSNAESSFGFFSLCFFTFPTTFYLRVIQPTSNAPYLPCVFLSMIVDCFFTNARSGWTRWRVATLSICAIGESDRMNLFYFYFYFIVQLCCHGSHGSN
jgi:hypothetical protein